MKPSKIKRLAAAVSLSLALGMTLQAQTPFYSVNGTGGTGGGTAGVTVNPSISPSGSTSLTDLGATTQFSFGTGPGGLAGESIVNAATGQPGAGVLVGTLGASSSMSAFTMTMWVNLAAGVNNYRLLEISSGSPPTTSTADGNQLFLGLNSGGGLQTYVNNVNGNSTATDIATAGTWNNGGTLGNIAANKWYFVAITYDTTAGSSLVYSGDINDSAVLAYTYGASMAAAGNLNLSAATSIALLDKFAAPLGISNQRNFPGAIADVSLYSGALTVAQIQGIQNSVVPAPEPGTVALGLGGLAMLAILRRRRN